MGEPIFGVLGPLRVRARGAPEPLPLGGPKPRAVLATLLLEPGAFVSLDVLTEVLWPGGAPRSAVANVRTYVRAVRAALRAAGIVTDGLRTLPSGYTLDAGPRGRVPGGARTAACRDRPAPRPGCSPRAGCAARR